MSDTNDDHKKWSREQLHGGDVYLNAQTGTNRFASQKGLTGFGAIRQNIYTTKDKGRIEHDRRAEDYIKPIYGTNRYASQKGQTPIGAVRSNVPKIVYKEEWGPEPNSDKMSNTMLPMQSGSNKFASQSGGVVFGAKRNQKANIRGRLPNDRKSQMFVPFQSGTNLYASQTGMFSPPGAAVPRQATTEVEGLNFTEDELRTGTQIINWQAGTNKYASQSGTGGFMKPRDVLTKMKGGLEVDPEWAQASEGILPAQSGTNRLASQKGMTPIGGARDVNMKPKWKQQWIQDWEDAERDFADSGRGKLVDQQKQRKAESAIQRMKSVPADDKAHASGDSSDEEYTSTFSYKAKSDKENTDNEASELETDDE